MVKITDKIFKIKNHMLFRNVDDAYIIKILNRPDTLIKNFSPEEIILSKNSNEKVLGLILSGEANVYAPGCDGGVLIKTLSPTDSFGVATLFGDSVKFVTTIVSKKASTVIFFSKSSVESLMDMSKDFRKNYITFLSQRICFLNEKISCFTAGSPEKKLSSFLCSESDKNEFSVSISSIRLSEMLDIGRATLYRAFDKMIEDGLIVKTGKTIYVPDRNKLIDFYKN